jgi:hypothetical protein
VQTSKTKAQITQIHMFSHKQSAALGAAYFPLLKMLADQAKPIYCLPDCLQHSFAINRKGWHTRRRGRSDCFFVLLHSLSHSRPFFALLVVVLLLLRSGLSGV